MKRATTLQRLGRRVVRSRALSERVTIIPTTITRTITGEAAEVAGTSSVVRGVSMPLAGEEREMLPAGLQERDSHRFLLPPSSVRAISPDSAGDLLRWNGKTYRVVTVRRWSGFDDAVAVRPATMPT